MSDEEILEARERDRAEINALLEPVLDAIVAHGILIGATSFDTFTGKYTFGREFKA